MIRPIVKMSYPEKIASLVAIFSLAGLLLVPVASFGAEAEILVPYEYGSWTVRDPFTPLVSTKVKPELIIHDLTLTGIIEIGGGKVAIFKRKKGPKQTYQLRGARLFGKDGNVLPAIRGKVLDAKTVLLIQGDEEIPFKLVDAGYQK
jgi:hypothetical protein